MLHGRLARSRNRAGTLEARDAAGTVAVGAPGPVATFRGATLDRQGRTLTVRPAP